MPWYFTVAPTPREQAAQAIEDAEVFGQALTAPGVAEDVAAAKSAATVLLERIKRPVVGVTVSGHTLQPGEDAAAADFLSVAMTGGELPPAPEGAAAPQASQGAPGDPAAPPVPPANPAPPEPPANA